MLRALDGGLDGMFLMGQNPAVGSMHAGLQRRALASVKWLVVRDLVEIESATFWRDAPEVQSGELRTEDIQTEVFLMPAASHVEKAGTFTNTQRLIQFRDKALEPPGDARSELWFMHHLFKRVQAHYAGSTDTRDWPIMNLTLGLRRARPDASPTSRTSCARSTATRPPTGELVAGFDELEDDGSTACGCWIYSGVFADNVNQARRRDPGDVEPGGGLARVGVGVAREPPHPLLARQRRPGGQAVVGAQEAHLVGRRAKWTGYDVPDFPVDKPPDYRPPPDAEGMDAIGGADPFIMMADGRAWLYAPSGLLDGPMPTHYEPIESPVDNLLYPAIHENPAALRWTRRDNPRGASPATRATRTWPRRSG